MKLSERLSCISDMVNKCECICDIGTDHAYIPIDLISKGIVKRAVASDVRKGPCETARRNIAENNLCDNIEVRMGSGFKTVKENECGSAVIAGMGGELMVSIFQEGGKIPRFMKQIVIQPQSFQEYVREYLYKNGYDIEKEALVYEDGKFYTVMSVKYTGISGEKDKIDYYIGRKLIENKDRNLNAYLDKEITRLKRILANADKEEYTWLLKELIRIREEISYV